MSLNGIEEELNIPFQKQANLKITFENQSSVKIARRRGYFVQNIYVFWTNHNTLNQEHKMNDR